MVFAKNYQKDYVGFIGDKYNLMNIQSGTINAQLVLTNGTEYTVRASAFSQFQYRTQNNSTYNDLTVSQIYNTNVQFADEKGDRGNVIHSFNEYEISTVFALVLLLIASIVNTLLLFRRS